MDYAFTFQDHGTFTPDGKVDIPASQVEASNQAKEQVELDWLKTHPDKVFLYVGHPQAKPGTVILASDHGWSINTWLGTPVATHVELGNRAYVGFDRWTYRRSVRCRIYGQLYVGWYMESSGQYCRLRKSTAKGK